MKISIIGLGYVGLSLGLLLSKKYKVVAYDNNKKKVQLLQQKISPIEDEDISKYLSKSFPNFCPTNDSKKAFENSDYYVVCTPTNYDDKKASFNTSSVTSVISQILEVNSNANIVIKSTVPIGFTKKTQQKFKSKKIFFSPEFLRESKSLHDNLFPSRIIVGDITNEADKFAKMLAECSNLERVNIIKMNANEAEAVKLFSNTFLAMRISFFNELDTFAEINGISTPKIIEGVSGDPRIGNYYNNPSFGYGGYCLPKDTKQLLENYKNIPNNIISGVVKANRTRKKHIAKSIIRIKPSVVGIYRLIMKSKSDNFRDSAIFDIIDILNDNSIEESIAYINSDREIETEEEELDKNVEFFYYSEKGSSKVNISLSTFWKQDLYQDIFLNRFVTPPKTNI